MFLLFETSWRVNLGSKRICKQPLKKNCWLAIPSFDTVKFKMFLPNVLLPKQTGSLLVYSSDKEFMSSKSNSRDVLLECDYINLSRFPLRHVTFPWPDISHRYLDQGSNKLQYSSTYIFVRGHHYRMESWYSKIPVFMWGLMGSIKTAVTRGEVRHIRGELRANW